MCKRHLKVHDFIKDAQQSMTREQGAQRASSTVLLSAEDTIMIEYFIKIIQNTEYVTALLGKSNSSSIKYVYIFTSNIICSLNEFVDSSSPIASIVLDFRYDIMKPRISVLNQFSIISPIVQVLSLLTPEHKCKTHSKYLVCNANPYAFTFDQALRILYKRSSLFIGDDG